MEDVIFFSTASEFGKWLDSNHQKLTEQWIGFYKVKSGIPSMTWPESVDQALCYGWIDGLRKSIDESSYKIRFTPRKLRSHWSVVNLEKMKALMAENLVAPAGLAIYEQRDKSNTNQASFERKDVSLSPGYEEVLKKNEEAWNFFEGLSPSVKKASVWWVISAKQEATRQRRLKVLIESSAAREKIPMLRRSGEKG
ncbi:YdeI/OmpD-associated family protein [Reichenbachiella carrageenanivorans]|uniref:YdeI/OmpD-associated family protein n=1 Tax=Reichenbachiella carrageenanivorans TaxID=2979869 RepID=A0ABY6D5N6_9BACT|nr:YdeI/OmpD-associated family protein [Reichenbachiella carrageenanivorans]UXX79160.1 YdeI/OmpD-associated family protein [Reichenbachiella carrageenanivorans]